MEKSNKGQLNTAGFQILETVISLGIVSVLLTVLLAAQKSTQLQQNTYYRTVARQLIIEEYEALRSTSYATLTNRINQPFMDVAYHNGTWKVATPSAPCLAPVPCSGGNALFVSEVSGDTNPSRAVVPAGWLGDGVYDLHFRSLAASSPDWKAGMHIRYRDDRNYYLLQATATTLSFTRVSSGTTIPLWSIDQSFASNTWYQLTVTAEGLGFTFALNGVEKGEVTDAISLSDPPLTFGRLLLHAEDGAAAEFDDVQYTNTASSPTTLLWNFDSSNDQLGRLAYGWRRIGPNDLPSGTTSLTISSYVSGGTTYTDLKTILLTVSWQERDATRSVTNTFYINKQSIAP